MDFAMNFAIKGLCDRTEDDKRAAMAADKASHAFLKSLRKRKGNDRCADCSSRCPGWAALPHGVFLCIDCAQVHRGLGRHISQVKSISSGTYLWYPDEIACMDTIGNKRANSWLLALQSKSEVTRPTDSRESIARHIADKYTNRKWFQKPKAEEIQEKRKTEMVPLVKSKSSNLTKTSTKTATTAPRRPRGLGGVKVEHFAEVEDLEVQEVKEEGQLQEHVIEADKPAEFAGVETPHHVKCAGIMAAFSTKPQPEALEEPVDFFAQFGVA